MRLSLLFWLALGFLALAHTTSAVALYDLGSNETGAVLRRERGDFNDLGLFGGFEDLPQEHALTDALTHTLGGTASATSTGSTDSTSTSKKPKDTSALPTGTSYSVIGTPPPIPTPTAPPTPAPPATPPASVSPTSTAAASSSSSSSSSGNEWKIIGVAVIAFSAVAAILLLAVFFDQWTRAVRRFLARGRRGGGAEELVPDWEKAEWGLRVDEGAERYPSFASLPSVPIVQPQPAHVATPGESRLPPSATGKEGFGRPRGPARNGEGAGGFGGIAGAGTPALGMGLGIDRVGSLRRAPSQRTPQTQHSPVSFQGQASKQDLRDPFADVPPSPMPEDVYAGMAT